MDLIPLRNDGQNPMRNDDQKVTNGKVVPYQHPTNTGTWPSNFTTLFFILALAPSITHYSLKIKETCTKSTLYLKSMLGIRFICFIINVCICVRCLHVCMYTASLLYALRSQNRVPCSLELKLQEIAKYHVVLKTEPGSLKEQQTLLTTGHSLQALGNRIFKW